MEFINEKSPKKLPDVLDNELYVFNGSNWINKCEIEVNGEKREFVCVYETKRYVINSITYGESYKVIRTDGTKIIIRGWKIDTNNCKDFDLSRLFDPKTMDDYTFRVIDGRVIIPRFKESAIMIREIQFFNSNPSGYLIRSRQRAK